MLRFVQDNSEADYASRVQSTPEKKRVTWKAVLEEVRYPMLDDPFNGDEEPNLVRCNLIKKCDNFLDPSEQADVCLDSQKSLDSLQNYSAEIRQPSNFEISTELMGPESKPLGFEPAISASESSPALSPAGMESHIEKAQQTVLSRDLSEEEKHAGMKRRYSMLQLNLKIPVEDERRLKRERLRNLVPIWSKKKPHAQLLDGCKNRLTR